MRQAPSVKLEPYGVISGPVHSVAYHKYAVHTESQQGEDAGAELQLSLAAMPASTVPTLVTFGGGVVDVRIFGLLIAAFVLAFRACNRSPKSSAQKTARLPPQNRNADSHSAYSLSMSANRRPVSVYQLYAQPMQAFPCLNEIPFRQVFTFFR